MPWGGIEERLLEKTTEDNNGCWLFHGGKAGAGYGTIWHESRMQYAHRVSWKLYCGSIEKGMLILHRCDVPNCINPEHLFIGTNKDNTQDMAQKGRAWWTK